MPGVAAEPVTVLILPFENATGRAAGKALENGFPDLVTAYLTAASDKIELVEREKLEGIMAEKSLAWENLLKDPSGQRAGRLVQAKYVLRGSVTGDGDHLQATGLLYETETTRLVKSFTGAGRPAAAAQAIASGVAQVFSAPLKPLPALPADADPETSLHMIYGLGYYHQGQYAKAFPEFMMILAKTPRDPGAKYWLGKSFYAMGMKTHASLEFKQFLEWFPKDPRAKVAAQLTL